MIAHKDERVFGWVSQHWANRSEDKIHNGDWCPVQGFAYSSVFSFPSRFFISSEQVPDMCQVSIWSTASDYSWWSCSFAWANSQACPQSSNLHKCLILNSVSYSGDLWIYKHDCNFLLPMDLWTSFVLIICRCLCVQTKFSKGAVFATWIARLFSRVSLNKPWDFDQAIGLLHL
jgi:hypothetical protein